MMGALSNSMLLLHAMMGAVSKLMLHATMMDKQTFLLIPMQMRSSLLCHCTC